MSRTKRRNKLLEAVPGYSQNEQSQNDDEVLNDLDDQKHQSDDELPSTQPITNNEVLNYLRTNLSSSSSKRQGNQTFFLSTG